MNDRPQSIRRALCENCGRNVRVLKDGTFAVHKANDPRSRRVGVNPDCADSLEVV